MALRRHLGSLVAVTLLAVAGCAPARSVSLHESTSVPGTSPGGMGSSPEDAIVTMGDAPERGRDRREVVPPTAAPPTATPTLTTRPPDPAPTADPHATGEPTATPTRTAPPPTTSPAPEASRTRGSPQPPAPTDTPDPTGSAGAPDELP